jgi:hypothetical protein
MLQVGCGHALEEWKLMNIPISIHCYEVCIGKHDKKYRLAILDCRFAIPLGMFVVYTSVLAVNRPTPCSVPCSSSISRNRQNTSQFCNHYIKALLDWRSTEQ